jgi:hypothetical protein
LVGVAGIGSGKIKVAIERERKDKINARRSNPVPRITARTDQSTSIRLAGGGS